MTQLEAIVDRAITSFRWAWAVHAVLVTALLWSLLDGWWLLVIPLWLSFSYQAGIYLTAHWIGRTIARSAVAEEADIEAQAAFDEVQRRLEADEIEPSPELYELMEKAGIDLSVVEQTSEKRIGRLGDFEIYEWVELYDSTTKRVERFFFHDYAEKDYDTGEPIMPRIEGHRSAILGGCCVYTRPLQPAQDK